jgi:hypothetical protein
MRLSTGMKSFDLDLTVSWSHTPHNHRTVKLEIGRFFSFEAIAIPIC